MISGPAMQQNEDVSGLLQLMTMLRLVGQNCHCCYAAMLPSQSLPSQMSSAWP